MDARTQGYAHAIGLMIAAPAVLIILGALWVAREERARKAEEICDDD